MHEPSSGYESYKDSGIPWVGDIPAHWDSQPGRACLYENKDKNFGMIESQVLSLSYGRIVVKSEDKLTGLVPESFETYQIVQPGDIIIRGTDLQNDVTSLRTGLAIDRGIITSAYINLRPRPNALPYFLHYILHSYDTQKVFYGLGSGLRQNLSYDDFKYIGIALPDLESQNRIVKFLDEKTVEIDAAIAKKRRLIDLLNEQRAILINRAVTKGLNPNAPIKDSGVDWIGEIPAHWEMKRNKEIFVEVNERSVGGQEQHLSMSQKLGLVPANLVERSLLSESYDGAKLVMPEDLVLNRLKAHLAVFSVAPMKGVISPDYSVFRPRVSDSVAGFFERLFKTTEYLGEFNRRVKGIVVGFYRLYSDDFMATPVIVPPPSEQREIQDHIVNISHEIACAIGPTESEIDKLIEFKQTLIANAVTGKIKI